MELNFNLKTDPTDPKEKNLVKPILTIIVYIVGIIFSVLVLYILNRLGILN